jgi:hypothetical protein
MVDVIAIINFLFIGLLAIFIHKKVKAQPLGKFFLPGLAIKCLGGILLGLLYITYYQGGDVILFHEDATVLARLASSSPFEYIRILLFNDRSSAYWDSLMLVDQPRALYTAKILSVCHILTGSNFWVSGFYFSFFAYSGLWVLANRLALYFPWSRNAAIIGCLFFPSVIFWSSGISKEAISIGLIGWIVAIYMPLFGRGTLIKKRGVFVSIILLMFLWLIKYYQAGILLAVLTPTIVVAYIKSFSIGVSWSFHKQVLYWLSFLVWTTLIATFIHPNLRLDSIIQVVVDNNVLFNSISDPEDLIVYKDLSASWKGVLRNLHIATFSGLFRPLTGDVSGLPQILAAIENVILFILTIVALLSLIRVNRTNNGILVIAILLYILVSAVLLAFSTPNFGTLVRYKSGFMPFLVYIILADFPLARLLK